jgi:hypothetical protein
VPWSLRWVRCVQKTSMHLLLCSGWVKSCSYYWCVSQVCQHLFIVLWAKWIVVILLPWLVYLAKVILGAHLTFIYLVTVIMFPQLIHCHMTCEWYRFPCKLWEHSKSQLVSNKDIGDFFDLCCFYRQLVGNGQVASIFPSAPFP